MDGDCGHSINSTVFQKIHVIIHMGNTLMKMSSGFVVMAVIILVGSAASGQDEYTISISDSGAIGETMGSDFQHDGTLRGSKNVWSGDTTIKNEATGQTFEGYIDRNGYGTVTDSDGIEYTVTPDDE